MNVLFSVKFMRDYKRRKKCFFRKKNFQLIRKKNAHRDQFGNFILFWLWKYKKEKFWNFVGFITQFQDQPRTTSKYTKKVKLNKLGREWRRWFNPLRPKLMSATNYSTIDAKDRSDLLHPVLGRFLVFIKEVLEFASMCFWPKMTRSIVGQNRFNLFLSKNYLADFWPKIIWPVFWPKMDWSIFGRKWFDRFLADNYLNGFWPQMIWPVFGRFIGRKWFGRFLQKIIWPVFVRKRFGRFLAENGLFGFFCQIGCGRFVSKNNLADFRSQMIKSIFWPKMILWFTAKNDLVDFWPKLKNDLTQFSNPSSSVTKLNRKQFGGYF